MKEISISSERRRPFERSGLFNVEVPLAGLVGDESFAAYQAAHMARTAWVVGPPMLTELLCTGLLLLKRPPRVPAWSAWLGAGLLGVVWGSTALLQVPAHSALLEGGGSVEHLVATNWIRTAAWSLRGGLSLVMIAWASAAWSAATPGAGEVG